jgi:hypothetical protein
MSSGLVGISDELQDVFNRSRRKANWVGKYKKKTSPGPTVIIAQIMTVAEALR